MRFAVRVPALLAAAALVAASPPPAATGRAAAVHLRWVTRGVSEGRQVEITVDRLGTSRLVRRCIADVCGGSWFDGQRRWTFGLNDVLLPDDDPGPGLGNGDAFGLDGTVEVPGPIVPPAGAAVTFGGTADLKLGSEPVPIVPCTLGGRNARCLIDTGATPSAVALPLAEALGLEPRGELELSGFGRMVTGYVDAKALAVGQARFANVRLAVIPQSSAARFDVVLGADLLARVRVWLDRRRGIASVDKPLVDVHGTRELTPFTEIALRFSGGTPRVDFALAGGAPQRALLDTGDQSVVSFGYAQYREGPQWPLVERLQALGLGGVDDAFAVTVPNVSVGGLALGPTRATVRRTQVNPHVGIGIWARGPVELDEGAARLVIQSR
jgi:hypothetical protein